MDITDYVNRFRRYLVRREAAESLSGLRVRSNEIGQRGD
jgi:hypothetical protein